MCAYQRLPASTGRFVYNWKGQIKQDYVSATDAMAGITRERQRKKICHYVKQCQFIAGKKMKKQPDMLILTHYDVAGTWMLQ